MSELKINHEKIAQLDGIEKLCPFNAILIENGQVNITSACKMCGICVKNGPKGAFYIIKSSDTAIDKSLWKGIIVYAENSSGHIHPVTFELIGKAAELAEKTGDKVHVLLGGYKIEKQVEQLLNCGVDSLFLYDYKELENFRIEPYTAIFEDLINKIKPSIVLVGGTASGRVLAPRIAARFRTGLTADCTTLDVQANGDLDQIRPAFGGNIMAHIRTVNHRPQFATVRYKVFNSKANLNLNETVLHKCEIEVSKLSSAISVVKHHQKPKLKNIEDAEIIVAVGRGFSKPEQLKMAYHLSELLGGDVGCSRPVVESGLVEPIRQIGLSGRTVKPKLIITCGISGSIQFRAGMTGSEIIFAINSDPHAPIFDIANYCLIGDAGKIIPELIEKLDSI